MGKQCLFLTLGCLLVSTACGCWIPADLTPQERQLAEDLKRQYAQDNLACTPEEATWQVDQFLFNYKSGRHSSACAVHWWLRQVAQHKLYGSRRTAIIDIGCNKAFFTGAALNYLAPGYGDHLQQLFKQHQKRGYAHPCGICNDCIMGPDDLPAQGQTQVDVLCVEPSEVHIKSLTMARDAIYGLPGETTNVASSRTKVNFNIFHGAFSNTSGTAQFTRNCTHEGCSIADKPVEFVSVAMSTVDSTMGPDAANSRWPYVDVMKIDTEGFDPAVLAGAYRSLLAHRIGILSFEYHLVWTRSGGTLNMCSKYLNDLGYACFYDAPVLAKVSDSCWDEKYELKQWTNIVCVLRGTPMEKELMAGSYLAWKLQKGAGIIHQVK